MPDSSKRSVDILIGSGLLTAEAIAQELRSRLVERLASARGRMSVQQMLHMVREILADFEPALAQALADVDLASWIVGIQAVANRLPRRALEEFLRLRPTPTFPAGPLLPPGTIIPVALPTTDEDFPRVRLPKIEKAVEDLHSRQILTRPRFDRASQALRQQAFTVARIASTGTIGKLRDVLERNVAEGASLQDFRRSVEEELGSSPIGPAHLENVFRTNTQAAYATGQKTIASNPIVQSVFPYKRYSAIDDGRVRDDHLALMKMGIQKTAIYRADDPFWEIFEPPWSWNCVAPGQKVKTDRGTIRIENVQKGDLVPTHLGNWRPVIGIHRSKGPSELVAIDLDEGASVRLTAEHGVFTENGWIESAALQEGDKVHQQLDSPATDLVRRKVNDGFYPECAHDMPISLFVGPLLTALQLDPNFQLGKVEVQPVWDSGFVEFVGHSSVSKGGSKSSFVATHIYEAVEMLRGIKARIPLSAFNRSPMEFGIEKATRSSLNGSHSNGAVGISVVNNGRFADVPDLQIATVKDTLERSVFHTGDAGDVGQAVSFFHIVSDCTLKSAWIRSLNYLFGALSIGRRAVRLLSGHSSSPRYRYATVRQVRKVPYRGDVFNLSVAGDKSYPVNGLTVSNCRCTSTYMTVRQAANAGILEAQTWLRTGVPPRVPDFRLQHIPFRPDPAFIGGGRVLVA